MNVEVATAGRLTRSVSPVDAPATAWPGWAHIRSTVAHAIRVSLVFAVVYGGADLIARLHSHRVSWYLPLEDRIPLVPAMTLLYSSLWLMFTLVPFVLRHEHELRGLSRLLRLEIVIAGLFFLAAPMADRPPHGDLGLFGAAFRAADWLNLEYNQFPSLHATFGFTLAAVLGSRCPPAGRLLLVLWSLGIGAAAVLTWQHAVLDVAGGAVLAAALLAWQARTTRL